MSGKDEYYNKSKQQGYRARSAYKLKQIDEEANLFERGDTVVDLGAAPGGWLQVAAEEVGESGTVVGVDLQRIDDLDDDHDVETIRGDMTEERTRHYLREAIGEARGADVVISDMAPNMTGEYALDHARSVHLARQAFDVAEGCCPGGGDFVVKVFQGEDLDARSARTSARSSSTSGRSRRRPRATPPRRCTRRRQGAEHRPVAAGDRIEVTVEERGDEGDGIAYVEGYSIFVSDADVGETVTVEVVDAKPRFGFATRVDVGTPPIPDESDEGE